MVHVDIDECTSEKHMCEHDCINNVGSYSCSCQEGYELVDQYHCKGKLLFGIHVYVN